MKNRVLYLITLGLIMAGLSGCYPGGAEFTEDLDLVITYYDDSYDFKAMKTYFLPDSIVHVSEEGIVDDVDRVYDDFILEELETHLDNLGLNRIDEIDEDNLPDIILFPAVTTLQIKSVFYYWWDYWGWYPWPPGWGWGPGWDWYYPPGYPVISTYEKGTLIFTMIDPENSDLEDKELVPLWIGIVDGLLGTSRPNTQKRIEWGIDQAFKQSPYLRGR